MPVLNESATLTDTLARLAPHRDANTELLVVDGGSRDRTPALAGPIADKVVTSERGRANQMRAGADAAGGDILLFLHADTRLPAAAFAQVREAIDAGAQWGRFDVRLSGRHPAFRVIEYMISWRSRMSGIATGDQAMFMHRDAYRAVGGFPRLALMEDVEMSKRLKRLGRPACLRAPVITSSRRWETNGIVRTVVKMWCLRTAYALGASPERLAPFYRHGE